MTFHSDRGGQYISDTFRQLLQESCVAQSFSNSGRPYNNAVVETFFATFKKEDFRRNYYKTEEEFRIAVKEYIEFYNNYRPHQRLGFLTPNQAEKEFMSRQRDNKMPTVACSPKRTVQFTVGIPKKDTQSYNKETNCEPGETGRNRRGGATA